MKNIFLLLFVVISCKTYAQQTIVPLRTYTDIPENQGYYLKDTNNELQDYEGTWKGIWNNKTIFITFHKIANKYNETLKFSTDYLAGKFKTLDNNGNILFDNTNLSFENSKIRGAGFQNITDKYLLSYVDSVLCGINGTIYIDFANSAKTQLNFSFHEEEVFIDTDCYFYGLP
ncbi:MAG TPA: hypothetical protein DIW37_10810, partial [Chryseobacterium sp.]|nr:hypothetical protein [Chryseobacterium sp.]